MSKSRIKRTVELNYYNEDFSIINCEASFGVKDLGETMLAHLTEDYRDEVQSDHVDHDIEIADRAAFIGPRE